MTILWSNSMCSANVTICEALRENNGTFDTGMSYFYDVSYAFIKNIGWRLNISDATLQVHGEYGSFGNESIGFSRLWRSKTAIFQFRFKDKLGLGLLAYKVGI